MSKKKTSSKTFANNFFNKKKFSEDMIAFRGDNNISLRVLGEKTGVPTPSLYRLETGLYYINIDHAVSVANAMGKKIGEYF